MVLDVNDPDILENAMKLYDSTDDEYDRNLCDGIIRGELIVRTLQSEIQQAKEENERIEEEIRRKRKDRRIREEICKKEDQKIREEIRKKEIEIQKLEEKIAVLKQNKMS